MLNQILKQYHFNETQMSAFIELLYLSGALDPDQLTSDLAFVGYSSQQIEAALTTLENALSHRGTPKFTEILLDHFLETSVPSESEALQHAFDWFVRSTQLHFYCRTIHEERWNTTIPRFLLANKEKCAELVKKIGLLENKYPIKQHYDILVILGACVPAISRRIEFTIKLIKDRAISADEIYLLSSDRALESWERKDDSVSLQAQTEAQALKELFSISFKETSIPVQEWTCIQNKNRPNRIDTLHYLSQQIAPDTLNNKKLLFITSIPELFSQVEDIDTTMDDLFPKAISYYAGERQDTIPSEYVIFRAMTSLGGGIFGSYSRVSCALGLERSPEKAKQRAQELSIHVEAPPGWSPLTSRSLF